MDYSTIKDSVSEYEELVATEREELDEKTKQKIRKLLTRPPDVTPIMIAVMLQKMHSRIYRSPIPMLGGWSKQKPS